MQPIIFISISARNYLAYSQAFYRRVQKLYPQSQNYIFVADDGEDLGAWVGEPAILQPISAIAQAVNMPFDYMRTIYEVTEFATAVKPFCLRWVMQQHPGACVVYCDTDMVLLSKMDELEAAIAQVAECVLTPHITAPLADNKLPDDFFFIQSGIYNLGFGAFCDTPQVRAFIDWWADKLTQHCTWQLDKGIHVDQKWVDYAPAFIEKCHILRHPGYNLAYWNLAHRRDIKHTVNGWLVNGLPLRLVHFSGNQIENAGDFSKHQNRFQKTEIGELATLLNEYQTAVLACGHLERKNLPYAYQRGQLFHNIPYYLRVAFRTCHRPNQVIEGQVEQQLWNWAWARCQAVPWLKGVTISNALHALYQVRPDLQKRFDINTWWGQWRLQRWQKKHYPDLQVGCKLAQLPRI